MPDHIHAIIQIGSDDLISVVRAVKSILGIWWNKRQGRKEELWQRSFYDRGIRTEQQMDEAIAYVFRNPVDEGLAADWTEYVWIGGELVDHS
jgi:putative transposase